MSFADLHAWAARWGLHPAALAELGQMASPEASGPLDASEASVSVRVRMEATRLGARLMRNNVGAAYDQSGGLVRYGLANESAAMNRRLKSSDLIGIRPVLVTPERVGTVIGQFVARETKRGGWTYTGKGREPAQLAFIALVNSMGGDACFAAGEGTFL